MLRLPNHWVWDFWLADDGSSYHLFFLKAPRSLGDPELRHKHARVGHAVSTDLVRWQELGDAIGPGSAGDIDDIATWTGSIVRDAAGTWFMFYTGSCSREDGLKQRIGLATSRDLAAWQKHPGSILESDPRWYESLPETEWFDEAWRDPWVFPDPTGDGWHMLITARANDGAPDERGVVGHARSHDLLEWETFAPLSAPGSGFGHLEVTQVEMVDGRPVLLFSCLASELGERRRASGQRGGIWTVTADALVGPYEIGRARQLTDESLYSGRIVRDRGGRWVMLAFRHTGAEGEFVGEITDPLPIELQRDGLGLMGAPA